MLENMTNRQTDQTVRVGRSTKRTASTLQSNYYNTRHREGSQVKQDEGMRVGEGV